MRDVNSTIQVTIMNDRPQGGSADLSDNSTIELIQNRRILKSDDNSRMKDYINDTDS